MEYPNGVYKCVQFSVCKLCTVNSVQIIDSLVHLFYNSQHETEIRSFTFFSFCFSLSLSGRTNSSYSYYNRKGENGFLFHTFIFHSMQLFNREDATKKKSNCSNSVWNAMEYNCNVNYMHNLFHFPNGIFAKSKRKWQQGKKYVFLFFGKNNFRWYFSHFHETHSKLEDEIKTWYQIAIQWLIVSKRNCQLLFFIRIFSKWSVNKNKQQRMAKWWQDYAFHSYDCINFKQRCAIRIFVIY